jgi:RimJ/RimL family protein N-acetyltransferase
MITELAQTDYSKVRPLFRSLCYHLSSAAVLDGNNPGRVFADDPAHARTAFMSSPEGLYLVGNPQNQAFNQALHRAIFDRGILGTTVRVFWILCDSEVWHEELASILDPRPPIPERRRHYLCREVRIDWRATLPGGFAVQRITDALLTHQRLAIPWHVTDWIANNWGSTAHFLQRGFGFAALDGDQVVSWSLADCVSGDACEIGIHTAEPYRRRGLATATAAAATEHALSSGYRVVGWHTEEHNLGSIGTAERVGFELERKYTMFYALVDKERHRAEMARIAARPPAQDAPAGTDSAAPHD